MNYISYNSVDNINGEGFRCTLHFSGCTHRCEGCFNKESWKFSNGLPFDKQMQDKVIFDLSHPYISGLTLSGGDSFHPRNAKELIPFIQRVKEELPDKTVWGWTGYLFEDMLKSPIQLELLSMVDVLIDGPFIKDLHEPDLLYKGSSNQRVIDVQKSLDGKIVYYRDGCKPNL